MYYDYRQENGESNTKHLKNFKNIVSAVDHLGGTMFSDGLLVKTEKEKDKNNGLPIKTDAEYSLIAKEKMLGVAFLKRADQQRYGKLMTSIRDQHSFKNDVYPESLHDAYELIENHSSTKLTKPKEEGSRFGRGRGRNERFTGRGGRGYTSGMQYAQQNAEIVPGSDGRTVARITCYRCQKMGHFADFCPEVVCGEQLHINAYEVAMGEDEGSFDEEEENEENSSAVVEEVEPDVELIVFLQNNDWEAHSSDDEDSLVMSFQYLHGGEDRYDDTDILIDTGSTVSMIRNKKC